MNTRTSFLPCVRSAAALVATLASVTVIAPSQAAVIYSNLDVNGLMAMASRPAAAAQFEIETADDFIVSSTTSINHASFIGLLPTGTSLSAVTSVGVEIYRTFPNDSDPTRTNGSPTFSTSQVPTRVNSPSDVAFAERDSGSGALTFTTSTLTTSFTAANSIQAGGIHPAPNFRTGGNGGVSGQEVEFDVDFTTPFVLGADHYFFVPLVSLSDGSTFLWLSASRPIDASGTPFVPDLQAWTRDDFLDPDWLRVGTDIVGGTNAPTFNAAFSLSGAAVTGTVPEPASMALLFAGAVAALAIRLRRRS